MESTVEAQMSAPNPSTVSAPLARLLRQIADASRIPDPPLPGHHQTSDSVHSSGVIHSPHTFVQNPSQNVATTSNIFTAPGDSPAAGTTPQSTISPQQDVETRFARSFVNHLRQQLSSGAGGRTIDQSQNQPQPSQPRVAVNMEAVSTTGQTTAGSSTTAAPSDFALSFANAVNSLSTASRQTGSSTTSFRAAAAAAGSPVGAAATTRAGRWTVNHAATFFQRRSSGNSNQSSANAATGTGHGQNGVPAISTGATLLARGRHHSGTVNPSIHPQFRSKTVCKLFCIACGSLMCRRGMKAILLGNTKVELYSTDIPPAGVQLVNHDYTTQNCHCRIRDAACLGCGNVVGYHVTQPCENCLEACNNGHFWMFHAEGVTCVERMDNSGSKLMRWSTLPGAEEDREVLENFCFDNAELVCR